MGFISEQNNFSIILRESLYNILAILDWKYDTYNKYVYQKKFHHFRISLSITYDRVVLFLANPQKEFSYTIYADQNCIYWYRAIWGFDKGSLF